MLSDLIKSKCELNKITTNNACNTLLKIKSKFRGGSNKAGKMLANYLKIKSERKIISSIVNDLDNTTAVSDVDISNAFYDFYKSLYTNDTHPAQSAFRNFFDPLPKNNSIFDNFQELEEDISLQEIMQAIRSLS